MTNKPPDSKNSKNSKASKSNKTNQRKPAAKAQLAAPAILLTKAVAAYAEATPAEPFQIAQHTFQDAYSALLDVVPRDKRRALLQQMRRDLEIVAARERHLPSANTGTGHISTEKFMADLEVQEIAQRTTDIATRQLLSGIELRTRLNVSAQALSAALRAKRLFCLQGLSGAYAYPAFFADSRHDRPVLEKVSKALGDLPGAAKWDFFMSPRISLGGKSPLEALAKGKVDAVMAAARAYADE